MIHVIVGEELGNCDFVKQYVVGCDGLLDAVKDYTPEWAESMTGIPAVDIDRIARYCRNDTLTVARLFCRFRGLPGPSDADVVIVD